MTEPLSLPEKPTGNTPQARGALEMLHRIHRKFDDWQELCRIGNKAKLELVADVFEESLHYLEDPDAMAALIGEVNQLAEVRASRWEATKDHDPADLILVTMLGIGKRKATKSQWLKAIRKGRKFASDRDSFLAWLEMKGGLIKAGEDAPAATEDEAEAQAEETSAGEADAAGEKSDLVTRFLRAIESRIQSAPVVELPAPMVQLPSKPNEESGQRFVSMLGIADVDANGTYTGKARIVDARVDEELLQRHMSLALPKRRSRTRKELRVAEERELARVNRVAIKKETNLLGRLKPDDVIQFNRAISVLNELDAGRGRYFTGNAEVPLMQIWDGPKARADISVANADFHPLDPGRYVNNAKPGALLAYEAPGPTADECTDAIRAFLQSIRPPERPQPPEAGSTLEDFLPDATREGAAEEHDGTLSGDGAGASPEQEAADA